MMLRLLPLDRNLVMPYLHHCMPVIMRSRFWSASRMPSRFTLPAASSSFSPSLMLRAARTWVSTRACRARMGGCGSSCRREGCSCFVLWLLCCTCCGTLKMGVCLHERAQAHRIPLTTPPSASTTGPSPPLHTLVDVDACRTQCAGCAVCCEGLPCRKGWVPTDRYLLQYQLQARAPRSSTAHPSPFLRAPLSQERQHTQTRHQIMHAGRGKRHSAAPGGRGHCARVHRLPSRDHRRSPRELRSPAINALCSSVHLVH